jgi:pilus assembly protein CpaE
VAPAPDAPVDAPAAVEAPEPEEEALIEQPRKRVRRPGRTKADTVLVFSGKGGVGKSVIATNLAVALSARGVKVALIDLNLQYGDVGVLLHAESHPTSIESLAQQGEQVDREYLDEVMATGPEDVRILLAPASPEFADLVTAASLRAILRELSRGYDYVIVDSPAHIEERVLEVMEVADQILVVSSFNITSVKDTKVTLKLLQSLGIERDRIAVVLNQVHPKVGFPREEIEKSLRREVLAHLPYDVRIDESIDNGRPAVIGEPRSEFSKQLRVVVDFLTPEEGAAVDAVGADQVRDRASKRRLFGR